MRRTCIALHGGAGPLPYWGMTPEREKLYREALRAALDAGTEVLDKGGPALDAVVAALVVLEDDPLFNAGVGSAINAERRVEMDASIMCGRTLNAGSVSCVTSIRNPVKLARLTFDHSPHVFLAGPGAEELGRMHGLEFVDNSFFLTRERIAWWNTMDPDEETDFRRDAGTAGAVALDCNGNLAAATSTGGLMMKKKGRVGDSPVIGAGTYANNETCAVSCSGTGENIIRAVAAHEISCLLKYRQVSLSDACEQTMQEKLTPFGGQAGLVAMDIHGEVKFVFNTERMYRAARNKDGDIMIKIYKNE